MIHDLDDSGQLPWLEERGIEVFRGSGALDGEVEPVISWGVLPLMTNMLRQTPLHQPMKDIMDRAIEAVVEEKRLAEVTRRPEPTLPAPATDDVVPQTA